jgi:2-polyprenyl-3-methyl-5-hydroxy-6-metoxy-1,4-benzoquinol methylase
MKLLDLFCGGGAAALGYGASGFDVTGIDIVRKP